MECMLLCFHVYIYIKAQKHARFHVFSPFRASFYPQLHHSSKRSVGLEKLQYSAIAWERGYSCKDLKLISYSIHTRLPSNATVMNKELCGLVIDPQRKPGCPNLTICQHPIRKGAAVMWVQEMLAADWSATTCAPWVHYVIACC